MRFRDHDEDKPEPDDGLEARLTADGADWLQETSPSFSDTPAALLPGVTRVEAASEEELVASPDDVLDEHRTVAAPTRGKWTRRAPLLVAAAVIALVAAVAIPLWANRSHTAAPVTAPTAPIGAPQCPQQDGGPLVDTGSIEPADGSLVPAEEPISILICEYPLPLEADDFLEPSMGATLDLEHQSLRRSRTVAKGLSSVSDDLSRYALSSETECSYFTASAGPDMPHPEGSDFRVALRYPTGIVWVSDSTGPNTCIFAQGSSAVSTGSYAHLFLRSLESGIWQPSERHSVECPTQADATPYAGENALPTPSVDTGGLLVPAELPSAVVLCGYLQVQPDSQPEAADVPGFDLPFTFIAQRLEVQGNFSALVSELRAAPVEDPSMMRCTKPTSTPTPQLVGLTYGSGGARQTIWIDARVGATCGLATNGDLWAGGGIAESVGAALAGKPWPGAKVLDLRPEAPGAMPSAPDTSAMTEPAPTTSAPSAGGTEDAPSSLSPEDQACVTPQFGGEGLSQTVIPAGYTSVYSCTRGDVDISPTLVAAINALAELPGTTSCPEPAPELEPGQSSFLVFLYPHREPVPVYFSRGCAASISNGSRVVAAPEAVLAELFALDGS